MGIGLWFLLALSFIFLTIGAVLILMTGTGNTWITVGLGFLVTFGVGALRHKGQSRAKVERQGRASIRVPARTGDRPVSYMRTGTPMPPDEVWGGVEDHEAHMNIWRRSGVWVDARAMVCRRAFVATFSPGIANDRPDLVYAFNLDLAEYYDDYALWDQEDPIVALDRCYSIARRVAENAARSLEDTGQDRVRVNALARLNVTD